MSQMLISHSSKKKSTPSSFNVAHHPTTSSLKFHPFYTLTNSESFSHLHQAIHLLLYQYGAKIDEAATSADDGRSEPKQVSFSHVVINNETKRHLFSYLEALEFRYRRDMPHVLSSMHHLMLCMDSICEENDDIGEGSAMQMDEAQQQPPSSIVGNNTHTAALRRLNSSTFTELCMASAILRFVTGLSEIMHQRKRSSSSNRANTPSIKASLHRIQIPEYIVSLRNRISHDVMPAYGVLVRAVRDSLKWIHVHYWEELVHNAKQSDDLCHHQLLKYADGEVLFDDLRDEDRWQVARIVVQREIFDNNLQVGTSFLERLLKDDSFENSSGGTTCRRLELSACILSEISHHVLSRALERKHIEQALKWFKWLLEDRVNAIWCAQLTQHLTSKRGTLKSDTHHKICDLMLALLEKKSKKQHSTTQAKKRRKVSDEGYTNADNENTTTTNDQRHIPRWELVSDEEAFELPVGHVFPYAAHSDYTYEHFQLDEKDLEKQFVRCRE